MNLFAGLIIVITIAGFLSIIGIVIALHSVKPWRKIKKNELDKYYDMSARGTRRHKDD